LVSCALLVVVAGVGVGWLISKNFVNKSSVVTKSNLTGNITEAGKLDSKVKYDTATGILQVGGISNEGSYHLVRDGGPSKNVYLTSSSVDLSKFVDKKVDIWGQTLASKKAGWLVDVAKIKLAQ